MSIDLKSIGCGAASGAIAGTVIGMCVGGIIIPSACESQARLPLFIHESANGDASGNTNADITFIFKCSIHIIFVAALIGAISGSIFGTGCACAKIIHKKCQNHKID